MLNQTMQEEAKIKFRAKRDRDFATVCKERVEAYFVTNGISRHANAEMYIKTALHLIALVVLYFAILSESFSVPVMLLLCVALGNVQGLIGVNISHDALHGSYTSSSKINKILGYTFDFCGLSSYIWKLTHNMVHHIYTNIPGVDHDINKAPAMRFSQKDERRWFHRFQHWYFVPLYSFTGLNWVFYSDYSYFLQESKKRRIPRSEVFWFFFFKALNVTIFLAIPLIYMTYPWWQILIGYVVLMCSGGFTVALIFQLAHLVEGLEYPEPDEEGFMESQWAEHEMRTTANFGTANPFINYICGGLNFQVEHHLFPYVCHVHYTKIAPIVKETAHEFGLPYNENPTGIAAVRSHVHLLKKLGSIPK